MKIAYYCFAGTAFIFKSLEPKMTKLGHEAAFLFPSYHYLHHFEKERAQGRVLYLYDNFNKNISMLHEDDCVDGFYQDSIDKVFGVDKSGLYRKLKSLERRKVATTIYQTYKRYILENKIEAVVFPDVETVDGVILMNVCLELNIQIAYYVGNRLFGGSFWALNQYDKLPKYFGEITTQDLDRATKFLTNYRQTGRAYPFASAPAESKMPSGNISFKFLRFLSNRFGAEKYRLDEDSQIHLKILMRLAGPYNAMRTLWSRLFHSKYFSNEIPSSPFIAYFLQYTPESSVNGLQPYYVDQIRAIEALLFSLPEGVKLAVKEHPSMRGVRSACFYKKLLHYGSLVLLAPEVPSKQLMEKSLAVSTVTGTVGLEAFISGKPCLQFGPNFFEHLNKKFLGLDDLKEWLTNVKNGSGHATSENVITEAIAKVFAISGDFFVLETSFYPNSLNESNLEKIADSLEKHFNRSKIV